MKPDVGRGSSPEDDLSGDAACDWREALPEARAFAEALGERLRETREAASRTAEDVARRARHLGLPWHRSTVGQIEQGKRSVTAAELLLFPLLYEKPLNALLPSTEAAIWMTPQTAVHGAELGRVLVEGYIPIATPADASSAEWHLLGMKDMLRDLVAAAEEDMAQWPADARAKYVAQPDEAETKGAKRLNTTPQYVAYASRELWGRGLAEERDARLAERPEPPASPRALQAARGHVTRTLLNELAPAVAEHERHRGEPSEPLKAVQTPTGTRYVRAFPKDGDDG
ncbi:helix-turn-helix transcriptional regulator [Streptomyces antibioticus]|uniref:helix-turn-helix transcriptional regulator n=1 Tax=Streptomyces antibioticus TaxID=1890 RepID=UPI0037159807